MIEYPLKAIVIKIASYGLQVQHLGKDIAELYDYFMKMKD
jgi:diphthamide synthase (EF-2-diphthine--ammonia ligase)